MLFTYSGEIRKEARQSGRKNARWAPYRPRKRIKFWKMYVIILWRVSSLISSSELLELLTLYSYFMITGTFTFKLLNGLAFSILSSSSSVVHASCGLCYKPKNEHGFVPNPSLKFLSHPKGCLFGKSKLSLSQAAATWHCLLSRDKDLSF